ncbi:MAG: cytochrome c biogenesis protein CcsA [candidate division WOR-3 bacterium]
MTGPVLLWLALGAYLVSGIVTVLGRRPVFWPGVVLSGLGLVLQVMFVVLRTIATGFLPFASRFEALALFALAVQAAGLSVSLGTRQYSAKVGTDLASVLLLVGALAPVGFHRGGDLNPLLDSPWFAGHILSAFAGYGCLVAGLVWSLVRVFDRELDQNPAVPLLLARAGLLLLGTGILTGAAWADAAWGSYWNWDPKESWALLTWTIMLVYLHVRSGRVRDVVFYGLGCAAMIFTFLGINLLRWGLHRY